MWHSVCLAKLKGSNLEYTYDVLRKLMEKCVVRKKAIYLYFNPISYKLLELPSSSNSQEC